MANESEKSDGIGSPNAMPSSESEPRKKSKNRAAMLDQAVDDLLQPSKRADVQKRPIQKRRRRRKMCKFYSRGHCKFNKRCHYTHADRGATQAKLQQSYISIHAAIVHGATTAVLEHCERYK